jgi:SsrA-binding protein
MAKSKDKKKAESRDKIVSDNRKANHKYEILEKIECGIVLHGSEVKSLRDGKLALDEAYAHIRDGELFLVNADIGLYPQASYLNHPPLRARKLLVHARELAKLAGRTTEKGYSLVPLRVYFNERGIAKVLLGVGRGKQDHDKRQDLKKKDANLDIQREMRKRNR